MIGVKGSPDDGYLTKTGANYADTRTASDADSLEDNQLDLGIDHTLLGDYIIQRSGIFFDTSILPNDAVIRSVSLRLALGFEWTSADNDDLCVVDAHDINQPLQLSDYGTIGDADTVYGSIAISDLDEYDPFEFFEIELSDSINEHINPQGYTSLGLRLRGDIDGSAPSSINRVTTKSGTDLARQPKLVIDYVARSDRVKVHGESKRKDNKYTIKAWKWDWDGEFGTGADGKNEAKAKKNLVKVWDDADFRGFQKNINGGVGECTFNLGRKFDDYGEGKDVDLYNMIEIISHADGGRGRPIYTGYISKYRPYIQGSDEGVEVTCLGYQSTLKFQTYHFNVKDLESTDQELAKFKLINESPTDLIAYMVDGHTWEFPDIDFPEWSDLPDLELEPVDAFSPLRYTDDSLDYSKNFVSAEFSLPTRYEVLDWCVEVSENIDYWYISGEGIIYFKEFSDRADHEFTFGKHFFSVDLEKSIEDTFNKTIISNRRQSQDRDVVALHYPKGIHTRLGSQHLKEGYLREELVEDQTLTDQASIITKVSKRNELVKEPRKFIQLRISAGKYDIDLIEPGHTCSITNMPETIKGIDLENMVIQRVRYMKDYVTLEVATKQEILRSQLTDPEPNKNLKVVGREDIPEKLSY